MKTLITLHMIAGLSTAILAIILAFTRYIVGPSKLYYVLLLILFVLVNIAGFLGAEVSFGPYHMALPIKFHQ